jgi:DNA-binding winged helix-turn-helix (wHTH) protein
MTTHNTKGATIDRIGSAFVGADLRASEPSPIHSPNPSTEPARDRLIWSTQKPIRLRNEMTELLSDIDGLPILVRLLVKDIPAEMQADAVSKDTDIHSLLSSTLKKMVDRMGGSSLRSEGPSKQPLAIVELLSSGEQLARRQAALNETVLRVGELELDLIDRTAKRGDRQIDLRPREFRLLKYMMQRSGNFLTRETLLKEVWNYKFVPKTNLVDVHMGRLRRQVDWSNEVPMIRNVRGVGFILSATPVPVVNLIRLAGSGESGDAAVR